MIVFFIFSLIITYKKYCFFKFYYIHLQKSQNVNKERIIHEKMKLL